MHVEIEWDEAKSRANEIKHGLSFEEARKLFENDLEYAEVFDGRYPPGEDRFKAIGPVGERMILVVFSEPREGVIRIISARDATPHETQLYIDFMERMYPHG